MWDRIKGITISFSSGLILVIGSYFVFSRNGNTLIGYGLLLLATAMYFINVIHAFKSIKRNNSTEFEVFRKTFKDPFLAIFLSTIYAGLGHIYAKKWLLGVIIFLGYYLLHDKISGYALVLLRQYLI